MVVHSSRETLDSLQYTWIHNFTTDLIVQKWLYCNTIFMIFYVYNDQQLLCFFSKWPKNSGWWIMTQSKTHYFFLSCPSCPQHFLRHRLQAMQQMRRLGPHPLFSTTGSNDRWPFWIHWCMEKVWNRNGYIKISHRTHVWYIYLHELVFFHGKCIGKYIPYMDGTGYGRYIQIYNVQIYFNVRTVLFNLSISDAGALSSTRSTHENIDVKWICLDMLSSHVKGWRCGKLMSIQQIAKPALCFNQDYYSQQQKWMFKSISRCFTCCFWLGGAWHWGLVVSCTHFDFI